MSALAAIPPRRCQFCNQLYHWSMSEHELNCTQNPANRCDFCGEKFGGTFLDPARSKLDNHCCHAKYLYKRQRLVDVGVVFEDDVEGSIGEDGLTSTRNRASAGANIWGLPAASADLYNRLPNGYGAKGPASSSRCGEDAFFLSWRSHDTGVPLGGTQVDPLGQLENDDSWTSTDQSGRHSSDSGRTLFARSNPAPTCSENLGPFTSCRFCDFSLNSLYNPGAVQNVALHESNCKWNPANSCRACGLQFSGCGVAGMAASLRRQHEQFCSMNPENSKTCRFCGLTFRNLVSGAAAVNLVAAHEKRCLANTDNRCNFCGLYNPGPVAAARHSNRCRRRLLEFDVERTAEVPLRITNWRAAGGENTSLGCPTYPVAFGDSTPRYWDNPSNDSLGPTLLSDCQGCKLTELAGFPNVADYTDHFEATSGGNGFYSEWASSQLSDRSTPKPYNQGLEFYCDAAADMLAHDNVTAAVEVEIASIEAHLAVFEGADLRRQLRDLLLHWHPDRSQPVSGNASRVVHAVFHHIQSRWKALRGIEATTPIF